MLNNMGSFIIR